MKTKVSSSAIWEDSIGYSRAVKVGNIIEVAGTTAVRNGDVVHTGDPYNQAKYIIKIIDHVLKQLDSGLEDVVRTRIYLKHVGDWEEVGKAHGEFFGTIKPACSMIAVSSMINPEMLVEIEATAIIS
ncbi:MAG: RidA family protein [Saprospiraceae bacterium]|jgi:enamine deaminase RidA (YjgF/YER057c/UK114 family)|nr:RidA family protein [Saprospiraceae bacterium]MBK9566763.1 RidA family protein [Saprospiraceae bacterium]MBP6445975.1 RidA family protein [Saprospiraceae bacterium]